RVATLNDQCNPQTCPPTYLARGGNDWLHGNAIAYTPDGNLLYSARSQDWIIKIAYENGAGAGDVLWRLGKDGDFVIDSTDPYPWFSHQHDPQIDSEGNLVVFDNGNLRQVNDPSAHSRGQVYRIDELNRIADLALNADLGYFAFALGSAQRLENGDYFFDVGFRSDATSISVEVDGFGQP